MRETAVFSLYTQYIIYVCIVQNSKMSINIKTTLKKEASEKTKHFITNMPKKKNIMQQIYNKHCIKHTKYKKNLNMNTFCYDLFILHKDHRIYSKILHIDYVLLHQQF